MVKAAKPAGETGRSSMDDQSWMAAAAAKTAAGDVDEQAVGPEEVRSQYGTADVGQEKLMLDTETWQR